MAQRPTPTTAQNRLTSVMRGVLEEDRFSYDAVGNRLTDIQQRSYTYNNGNELLTQNGTSFSFDANGNMVSKTDTCGTTTYQYDSENRLIGIIGFSPNCQPLTASYKYDPFGRRIEKNVNGVVTRYVYDREDILFELDGSGNVVTEYLHGPGIDEPIAMIKNNQTYYYHADGVGSIIAITDSSGRVVQRYEYNSFGEITYQQDANFKQPYTYTGREYDTESGLYYYRARYYDPKIGKFISQDPIGFAGGDVNLYSYVGNNPINRNDPLGLWYVDVNVSGGFGGGLTGGVLINNNGLYPYIGGGIVTPGAGGSVTWSPSDPTTGWNVGLQGQAGIAGQIGYGFGDNGGWFWEVGGGWPPGASLTGYYVFGPFFGPKPKDPCKK